VSAKAKGLTTQSDKKNNKWRQSSLKKTNLTTKGSILEANPEKPYRVRYLIQYIMPKQNYVGFNNPKHETQVKNGFRDVKSLLLKADAVLNKLITNDISIVKTIEEKRFRTWFGTATVPNFTAIRSSIHMMTRQLSIDTTLSDDPLSDDVAYIHPLAGQNFGTQALNYADAQPPALVPNPTIHIGSGFYTAPLLGIDSQVGTIIHELSHLVCSTEDVPNPNGGDYPDGFGDTYGEKNCKWLAVNHEAQARHNADNFLFYCCSFDLR
jgi:hypothetical protein